MNKPVIGILAVPYIDKKNERKDLNNEIFIGKDLLNIFKKNGLDYLVIPYNLKKPELTNVVKKVDGLIFPGSQIGNYYLEKEFRKHYNSQKFLIKIAKKINKFERSFPILAICHGFHNLILIEKNIYPTLKNRDKLFMNIEAFEEYKTSPKFTKSGSKFKKIYNKTRKIVHNNSMGFSRKTINFLKKISIIALSKDKKGKTFVNIIKYKKYPFYGFQSHPERSNPELLSPFFYDVKNNVFKKSKELSKANKIKTLYKKSRIVKCSKYGLAKKTSKRKCCFYKI